MMCSAPPELRSWQAARDKARLAATLAVAERALMTARVKAGRHPVTGVQLAFHWAWDGKQLAEVPWVSS